MGKKKKIERKCPIDSDLARPKKSRSKMKSKIRKRIKSKSKRRIWRRTSFS